MRWRFPSRPSSGAERVFDPRTRMSGVSPDADIDGSEPDDSNRCIAGTAKVRFVLSVGSREKYD